MEDLKINGVEIDGELTDCSTLYLGVGYEYDHAGSYINKSESIQIIKHLIAVFEIDKDKDL